MTVFAAVSATEIAMLLKKSDVKLDTTLRNISQCIRYFYAGGFRVVFKVLQNTLLGSIQRLSDSCFLLLGSRIQCIQVLLGSTPNVPVHFAAILPTLSPALPIDLYRIGKSHQLLSYLLRSGKIQFVLHGC